MIVLGLETSCDDTSAGIYDGRDLLANVVSTQLVHRQFGGVVPELASRAHIQLVLPVIQESLREAGLSVSDIEGLAVTYGPGLAGSLLVGLSVAKGLALALNIPLTGINHLEGHIWSNRLAHPDLEPPFVVLIASGGHTQIVFVRQWGQYTVMGRTRDDASGEAFDKVGKLLELGYPGGPAIEKLARSGDACAIAFPRAFLEEGSFDFSFSGLKTAVLNWVRNADAETVQSRLPDIAASFQEAVVDVLVEKTIAAARYSGVSRLVMAGGVAVNGRLRNRMAERGAEEGMDVLWPTPQLCTDNGGMIAAAGHASFARGDRSDLMLSPVPSLNLS